MSNALELKIRLEDGIRVNAVAPGFIETEMLDQMTDADFKKPERHRSHSDVMEKRKRLQIQLHFWHPKKRPISPVR